MPVFLGIVIALLVGAAGAAGGYLYRKQASEKKIGRTEQYAKNLLEDAQRKADEKKKETILEAKEEVLRLKTELDRECKDRRAEVQRSERRILQREETLDKKQDAYKAEVEKTANKREVFETARKMDEEMRDIINDVFGFDICTALFGEMNVYALADGLPVWANLMLSIMDEVDTTFARESKATNPRISKYTKKYHK